MSNKELVAQRALLIIPFKEYRGFHLFEVPRFINVIEQPNWDDVFHSVEEVENYIDYCLDMNESL